MPRLARVVIPDLPHHVTQRGNRRLPTYFEAGDYEAYRTLMAEWCQQHGVAVWAYCLMPNHVHLIMVPPSEDALCRAVGEAHRRYSRFINFREDWRGHLWQGRFRSAVMDEAYLLAAARYVELNPLRASLVTDPRDYPYSSAAAHYAGKDDALVMVEPLLQLVGNWDRFLAAGLSDQELEKLRLHERTGRPLGSDAFVDDLEVRLGRPLRPRKPGRKPKPAP